MARPPKRGCGGESFYGYNPVDVIDARAPRGPTSKPVPGPRGLSAYEVAVLEGFRGTRPEWLLSLKGEPGEGIESFNTDLVAYYEESKN